MMKNEPPIMIFLFSHHDNHDGNGRFSTAAHHDFREILIYQTCAAARRADSALPAMPDPSPRRRPWVGPGGVETLQCATLSSSSSPSGDNPKDISA